MDYREALEAVVARTKHERYRALCDDDHPDHEAWRAFIIAKAAEQPHPAHPPLPTSPTVQRQRLLLALAKNCPYREPSDACGCGASKCYASLGSSRVDPKAASLNDCLECVATLLPDQFAST